VSSSIGILELNSLRSIISQDNPEKDDGRNNDDRTPDEDEGDEDDDDDDEDEEDEDEEDEDEDEDDEHPIPPPDADTLKFATATLPFYLSNADYNPELAIYACSLLDQGIGEKQDKLHSEIMLLHETIGLYLKVNFDGFILVSLSRLTGPTEDPCYIEPIPRAVPGIGQPTHQFGEQVKRNQNTGLI
jgi:hypothetical protein